MPADLAVPIISEIEQYKSSLRACYASYGASLLSFEVGRLSGKGGHAHVQVSFRFPTKSFEKNLVSRLVFFFRSVRFPMLSQATQRRPSGARARSKASLSRKMARQPSSDKACRTITSGWTFRMARLLSTSSNLELLSRCSLGGALPARRLLCARFPHQELTEVYLSLAGQRSPRCWGYPSELIGRHVSSRMRRRRATAFVSRRRSRGSTRANRNPTLRFLPVEGPPKDDRPLKRRDQLFATTPWATPELEGPRYRLAGPRKSDVTVVRLPRSGLCALAEVSCMSPHSARETPRMHTVRCAKS